MKKNHVLWKRVWMFMLALGTAVVLSGCSMVTRIAIQSGMAESPYYHEGDTWWDHGGIEEYYFNHLPSELNEIYRELYSRLANNEDSATLYAQVSTDDFWRAYYAVLADHPEFFWIGNSATVSESMLSGKVVGYQISTVVDKKDRPAMKGLLEAAADRIIAQIDPNASTYQKIKYIYETLINETTYETGSPGNQSIQSVLLNHRSVCAGYSKAFQYLLHRMGLFCTYITGQAANGGDHGWNIVRIDDLYYHVDVTWGDPVFVNEQESTQSSKVMNYNYLCCTDSELLRTHVPDGSIPLPACTDDSYNYYRLTGAFYESFDYAAVYDALMNSVWNDQDCIQLKFGSAEAYEAAKYELFSNGMIQDAAQYLMKTYGANSWSYKYHSDDDFYLITIYWK